MSEPKILPGLPLGKSHLTQSSADRLKLHFCELLGLDPAKTTDLRIDVDHERATVRWDGVWTTDAETITAIINGLELEVDRPKSD